jgi:hypothetical protein
VNADDAEEYTQALGQVVAGGYRQVGLGVRLGVPAALGLSIREWAEERLGGYVRMAIPERQVAARELVASGLTQRQTADVLGVDHETVNRDLRRPRGASAPRVKEDQPKDADSGANAPPPLRPDVDPDVAEARRRQRVITEHLAAVLALDPPPAFTAATRVDRWMDHLNGTRIDPGALRRVAELLIELADRMEPT